jgi:TatD DNase family protein
MTVYIDAHTHNSDWNNHFAVHNLKFNEVEGFLASHKTEFCSVGIHPWDVHTLRTDVLEKIELWASDVRVKAIGECGLDKNSQATIKEQAYFFERQIAISENLSKPMIIHCVAAFNEIIALRKRIKPQQIWIIHGFRGKPQMAKQLLDAGFALSFGENYNPLSVELTPMDMLCIETDEGKTPIEQLYKEIASIKACLPDELNAACQLLRLYVCI